ncbi:MAG: ACP S-malonyltransferase [Anaerolineae bacterium]|nr:ACP S-malonyltransferase [Anaerolineae bacterium]
MPLSELMFEGPEDELGDTAITQPAMYVCSIAMLRALKIELATIQPTCVAGHSLGEFSALTVAGSLSFEDGLRLVRERGRLMKEAGEKHRGSMAALLGITSEKAEALVKSASEKTGKPVVIANDNCLGQIVISGDNEALAAAVDMAKEYGARRVLPLAVSVATHSPLMQSAKEEFTKLVQETAFIAPSVPIYANVTAKPIKTIEDIRTELEEQITSSVRWTQSIQAMIDAGIDTFVEIGSKNILTGLMRRIDKTKTAIAINDVSTLQAFVQDYS